MKNIFSKIKNFLKGKELEILYVLFCVALVTANVIGSKVFTLGFNLFGAPVALTTGAIVYPFTFLFTDIIGEKYGKKKATAAVFYGFVAQIFALIFIIIAKFLPSVDPTGAAQLAYDTQLGQSFVFVIASLTAYLISQFSDVKVFHAIRNKYVAKHGSTKGGRWIWNNASTITSQLLDSVLYAGIAFGLGFGWLWTQPIALLNMILAQWIIKAVIALLDTPIFYLFTKNSTKAEIAAEEAEDVVEEAKA